MNNLERFRRVMNFETADRLPSLEFAGWWEKTLERWYGEGLPRDMTDHGEIRESLGLDCFRQLWISPFAGSAKEPECYGAPLVGSRSEYSEFKARHLFPDPPFDPEEIASWRSPHDKGEMVVWITLEGFFWFPRTLLGIEQHLFAFNDMPELVLEINTDLLEYNLKALDFFCGVVTPDFMTFAEDMSFKQGPMISRETFDEFLAPFYGRIVPALKEKGIIPMMDSDGDVTEMIPWIEDAGLEGILPLERQAGVDVAKIRERHPRFRMIGAFDKTVMHRGEAEIRREFERLLPVMRRGGFIPCVDHQTPPDVSLEQYRLYVSLLKEYCAKGVQ